MQFALHNNLKKEAEPNLKGLCIHCQGEVIAKCGAKNIWHWAHLKNENCDSWTEPETQWHRDWKNKFGTDHSEIRILKDTTYHIADVLNKDGIVFEFQNSPISSEIIRTREEFYGEKMIWIVNGSLFKNNFIIVEESFLKHWKFSILDEFTALNYPGIKNTLIVEAWQVQKEEVRSYLIQSGFVYDTTLTIYSLDLTKRKSNNREQLILKIEEEVYELYISFKKAEVSEKAHFFWEHPRRSWEEARRPVFIDFDKNFLFLINSGHGKRTGTGIKISKSKFLDKYC